MDIKGVGVTNLDQVANKIDQSSIGQTVGTGSPSGERVNIQGFKTVNDKQLNDAADKLNKFLEDKKTHVEYEIYDKFKEPMFKIVDDNSGEVIQEIPSKKVLDMVAKMCELAGLLVDDKA